MSQQPDPARPRPRRATAKSKATSINGSQPPKKAQARPAPDDREGWRIYWKEHQQPWRIEPEINTQRQEELAARRAIVPDAEKGIYPFSGMKLTRADIEWLLATHENGRGPVDWFDESQHKRKGLDLRGADLGGNEGRPLSLKWLPLARLVGGLSPTEVWHVTEEQEKLAGVVLTGADLRGAYLEGAFLGEAHLERTFLGEAHLEGAFLPGAQLEGAFLPGAHLEKAYLVGAQLKGADLSEAQLEGTDLSEAQLEGAHLVKVILADVLGVGPELADVRWDGTNLAVVDWSQVRILGDEDTAQRDKFGDKERRLDQYRKAVRA